MIGWNKRKSDVGERPEHGGSEFITRTRSAQHVFRYLNCVSSLVACMQIMPS